MNKVMIVDDERMIVNSLALGFDWAGAGFEVVATATGAGEALTLIDSLYPDVVFTDIKMPGMSGIDLMTEARKRHPEIQFVVISGHADFTYAQKALHLGAIAYCLKPLEDEDIRGALTAAAREIQTMAALRQASLRRFLDAPSKENARALVASALPSPAPGAEEGEIGVGLSLGDAAPLFTGNMRYVEMMIDDRARLYLFASGLSYLESPAFQAALLNAATQRRVSAFVYDCSSAPDALLAGRIVDLSDELYVSFLNAASLCLGKAPPRPARGAAFTDSLALLANKNRAREVEQRLSSMTGEERARLTMRDAVRIRNLCEALLCRMNNQPCQSEIRYAFELARLYPDFDQMISSLYKRLHKAVSSAVDVDRLHNETLAQIIRELSGCFTESLSFQDISARYHISPSYLSQLFKRELGTTFTEYVTRLRILYARELLESTSMLVSEVGSRAGYDNYLHFTKLFKRETGMTPKQYRASQHAGTERGE